MRKPDLTKVIRAAVYHDADGRITSETTTLMRGEPVPEGMTFAVVEPGGVQIVQSGSARTVQPWPASEA